MYFKASELIAELRKVLPFRVLTLDTTDSHPLDKGPAVMIQVERETFGSFERKRLATRATITLTSLATTRTEAEDVLYDAHLLLERGINTEHYTFCSSDTVQEPQLFSTLPQGSGYQAVSILTLIYKEKPHGN